MLDAPTLDAVWTETGHCTGTPPCPDSAANPPRFPGTPLLGAPWVGEERREPQRAAPAPSGGVARMERSGATGMVVS